MTSGDFGGRDRAFASVISRRRRDIELWEMTNFEKDDIAPDPDNANVLQENRVTWVVEFPAFTWGDETMLRSWWDANSGWTACSARSVRHGVSARQSGLLDFVASGRSARLVIPGRCQRSDRLSARSLSGVFCGQHGHAYPDPSNYC
jgi:hypothetical protein